MKLEDHTYKTIMRLLEVRRGRQWIPFSKGETLSLIRHFFRDDREMAKLKGERDLLRIDNRKYRRALRKLGARICRDGTIEVQGSIL